MQRTAVWSESAATRVAGVPGTGTNTYDLRVLQRAVWPLSLSQCDVLLALGFFVCPTRQVRVPARVRGLYERSGFGLAGCIWYLLPPISICVAKA